MSRLRPIEARRLVRALEQLGYRRVRQSGSHLKLRHPDGRTLVVPVHAAKPVKAGILRQAGLTMEELEALL
ncbi:MAG TPA: type II toxin-antitoxin system HicA family toxin [Candidatus Thermoplasmatota archaeon]|nr:type II toxin-antitoxin system HicA family toxin [Candidatus Thermoplasmatota archaeon]